MKSRNNIMLARIDDRPQLKPSGLIFDFSVYLCDLCGSLFMHKKATKTPYKHHRLGRLLSKTGQSYGRSPIEVFFGL